MSDGRGSRAASRLTLFLCGDVMPARGIDQILPHSCPPRLYESVATSALDYVDMAERANGSIPRPVDYAYVWGDALEIIDRVRPDARIIDLETSVTTSEDALPKGINYRMHPDNAPLLAAASIHCCVLANNHVLDWGEAGLVETLDVLARAAIPVAGAGMDLEAARAPAILELEGGANRLLVFGFARSDSGVPEHWAAMAGKPGIHLLSSRLDDAVEQVGRVVRAVKRVGDIAIASVHWGSNWGYDIPSRHRELAHHLIDHAGIDLIHGHSSHHPKAGEVYRGRLILYGCGDLLNDYEGIPGHERYRDDLVLMYFPTLDLQTGVLTELRIAPLQIRRFRLSRPTAIDRAWLRDTLDREYRRFGRRVSLHDGFLTLQ